MTRLCSKLIVALVTVSAGAIGQTPNTTSPGQAEQQPATQLPANPTQPQTPPAAPVPPAGAASGQNPGEPVDPARYVIGAEDSLQITVWREPTLSGTIPVRPDGMISLALVGDLKAAGLTPMALSSDISQKLKKYIQDPVVTVVVLGVNSQRIFAVGEINKVGPIMLTAGMTPLQAIVSAGGLTPFANSKKIYILRTVNGKQEKIPFNYKGALRGETQGIPLIPGDTIVVP
ncbi:MAG TPA: polysaccharide biosynthesis/export family protein [Edaphobacter sp.]|nr:polysaccharide biosynthesis/export family protein [Edaphobacter sp.]